MKRQLSWSLLLVGLLISCQEAQPLTQEVAASVLDNDYRMCAQCGGTFIRIDTTTYNAVVNGFLPNTPVLVRYQKENASGAIKWITIQTIRKR